MTDRPERIHVVSIGLDQTADNDLSLTVYDERRLLATDPIRLLLPLDVAVPFLGDLTNRTIQSVRSAFIAVSSGDCSTCANVRFIEEPAPGGRTKHVRCPACGPAYTAALDAPFARPRFGGGVR